MGLRHEASRQGGFTIIELLVVILIIGILAAIALPKFLGPKNSAEDANALSLMRNAVAATNTYYFTHGESYSGMNLARVAEIEPTISTIGLTDGTVPPGRTHGHKDRIGMHVAASGQYIELSVLSRGSKAYAALINRGDPAGGLSPGNECMAASTANIGGAQAAAGNKFTAGNCKAISGP